MKKTLKKKRKKIKQQGMVCTYCEGSWRSIKSILLLRQMQLIVNIIQYIHILICLVICSDI